MAVNNESNLQSRHCVYGIETMYNLNNQEENAFK